MISVGDTVRYSNKYIKFLGTSELRNKLNKVVFIISETYNWKDKAYNKIVSLSNNKTISTYWLRVVRKGKKLAEVTPTKRVP